ncbi:hypothetical protein B0T25DRAFT_582651 [Lasiosphaeria hispida]|uniref:Glycosyl transferase family 1 domain-containing protein n=1 Tax=Lasiosphaeria hispida TaxID=260671 RepID=A0AAJ0HFA9_9PEZI|nr:hypothetical protein B0T25DRAFT_582651 [Lasiosphaeria hispida]
MPDGVDMRKVPLAASQPPIPEAQMRIFLVQTAQGLTPSSGGYKANVNFLRQMRDFGHEAAQICYGFGKEVEWFAERATDKGIKPDVQTIDLDVTDPKNITYNMKVITFNDEYGIKNIVISRDIFNHAYPVKEFFVDTKAYLENGEEHATERIKSLIHLFSTQIKEFRPTHVMFNDALTMSITCTHEDRALFKRVAIIHTAEQLPFGPFCAGIDGHCVSAKLENKMLRDLDRIWSVSKAIQSYAKEHGNLHTEYFVHSTRTYMDAETGAMPLVRHNVDKDEVGMINPCPHKGLSILLALAKSLPDIKFVTWKSWGSEPQHLAQLEALPNIEIQATTENTDEIWDRIKVLIAPSVWLEAWGIVVTEAQLRGIPVIASNAGGLKEAKIGLPYCIPVNMITGERHANGNYVVPEQDAGPWVDALVKLMTDRVAYETLAHATEVGAAKWLQGLNDHAHEEWLLGMMDTT